MTPRDLVAQWRKECDRYDALASQYREMLKEDGEEDQGPYYNDGRAITYSRCADELSAVLDAQEQAMKALEQEIKALAIQSREWSGVPCQIDSLWHADTYDQWANRLAALRGDR